MKAKEVIMRNNIIDLIVLTFSIGCIISALALSFNAIPF
jgi:hypothetical protein